MEITEAEVLHVVDRALAGMGGILVELGDELANARPDLPGANTPYAIVTHCLGVLDFWVGQCIAGRAVERDRDAEFRASGPIAPLLERVTAAHEQVAADIAGMDGSAAVRVPGRHPLHGEIASAGAALLHAFEELAQHHGQLELTRDVLRSTRA